MTYVIDASVALKWFLREEDSEGADALFDAFLLNKIQLLAPDVLLLEIANALWKQTVLLKRLHSQEALAIFHDFLTLPLNLQSTNPLARSALELAVKHHHPFYDTFYCALALDHACEFVTADQVLITKLGSSLPFLRHLSTIRI